VNPAGGPEKADIDAAIGEGEDGRRAWVDALATGARQKPEWEGTDDYISWSLMQANQRLCQPEPRPVKPFQKWMRTLHKRALRRQDQGTFGGDGGSPACFRGTEDGEPAAGWCAHRRRSSSDSSLAFVTGVKSASISLAGVSFLTRSPRTTILSSRDPRTDRSSRASFSGARHSEDSYCPERQASVDPEVAQRALQRRLILEELISTEEGYIGDVRFLMNVGLARHSSEISGCL
jgi:hypothetical protein